MGLSWYNPLVHKLIKKLGQNLLRDTKIADVMVNALDLQTDDVVMEIGPGGGVLTHRILAHNAVDFLAVEYDPRFAEDLKKLYEMNPRVTIVHNNVLKWFPQNIPQKKYKVIGSLPYYITSPIVHMLIKADPRPDISVIMTQKEVAEKIATQIPDSSYLSIFVQTFFDVNVLAVVTRDKFVPAPKVDSAVVRLDRKDAFVPKELVRKYEGFLHKGYTSPRKMLNKVFAPELLEKINIDPNLRPQNLTVEDWLKLFYSLYN